MIAMVRGDGEEEMESNDDPNDVIVDDGDLPVEDEQQEKERRKSKKSPCFFHLLFTLSHLS